MTCQVLDTTVLSNFAHVQRPDLLYRILGSTAITAANVMAELRMGEVRGLVPRCDWRWLAVVKPEPEEERLANAFRDRVDAGEAECLAMAILRHCAILTDDFAARRLAAEQGVPVSGTLGLLARLVQVQHLSLAHADRLLADMRSHGYRVPIRSLAELGLELG